MRAPVTLRGQKRNIPQLFYTLLHKYDAMVLIIRVLIFMQLHISLSLVRVKEKTAATAQLSRFKAVPRCWTGVCEGFIQVRVRKDAKVHTLKREALMYLALSSMSSSEDIS